jgi:hypothetical protein
LRPAQRHSNLLRNFLYGRRFRSSALRDPHCSFGSSSSFSTASVIFDQVIELSLRADVRFAPESDQDRAATQYVAMGHIRTHAAQKLR